MALTYFKRFRMEIDLRRRRPEPPPLPAAYTLLSWDPAMLDAHADVKARSFQFEIDASVFPALASREGCRRLMRDISTREGFLAEATWLACRRVPTGLEYAGTVQGIVDEFGFGAVQNLGVTREHRGCGLGAALLCRAVEGFRTHGLARAYLEVTAHNEGAVRLYERLGFRRVKTLYKAVEVEYA